MVGGIDLQPCQSMSDKGLQNILIGLIAGSPRVGQHRDAACPADQLQGFQGSEPLHLGKGRFPGCKEVSIEGNDPSGGVLPVKIAMQPGGLLGFGFRQEGLSDGRARRYRVAGSSDDLFNVISKPESRSRPTLAFACWRLPSAKP